MTQENQVDDQLPSVVEFETDIADAEAIPPLPAGTYPADVVESKVVKSKNSDNKFIETTFRIYADSYPVDYKNDKPYIDVKYRKPMLGQQDSAFQLKTLLTSLGLSAPKSKTFDPASLVSTPGLLTITHRDFNGRAYEEITKIQPRT